MCLLFCRAHFVSCLSLNAISPPPPPYTTVVLLCHNLNTIHATPLPFSAARPSPPQRSRSVKKFKAETPSSMRSPPLCPAIRRLLDFRPARRSDLRQSGIKTMARHPSRGERGVRARALRDQRHAEVWRGHAAGLLRGCSFASEVHPGSTSMFLRAKVARGNESVERTEVHSLVRLLHFDSC